MLRGSSLVRMLFILPFSFTSAGGVSDGGTGIATEIDCQFQDSQGTFIFSVLAPPNELPIGSGNNSILLKSVENNGQEEVEFADQFQTNRQLLRQNKETFIIYSDGLPGGLDVTVETQFIALSPEERSKLKVIRKDIAGAGYSKAILSNKKRNLNLPGICVFRQ